MQNKLKGKRILVTGCAGFIPSHLVESLLNWGVIVIGIDNLSTGSKENMVNFQNNKNFQFIKEDVRNVKLVNSLIKESEYVYHGAVSGIGVSTDNPIEELSVNTESTVIILEATRKYGIKRFIYPSSASVYGNPSIIPEKEEDPAIPLSPYGVSKLAAERYCIVYHHLYGIPVVCLRYFNTYGPRQRSDSIYGGVISIFLNRALKNKQLEIYGNGMQTRDFTYITDTIEATIQSFTSPYISGKVINIAGGKEYSIIELAKFINKITQNKHNNIIHVEKREVDNIGRRIGDITLAKKYLKFYPQISLETGIKILFQWNKKYARKI